MPRVKYYRVLVYTPHEPPLNSPGSFMSRVNHLIADRFPGSIWKPGLPYHQVILTEDSLDELALLYDVDIVEHITLHNAGIPLTEYSLTDYSLYLEQEGKQATKGMDWEDPIFRKISFVYGRVRQYLDNVVWMQVLDYEQYQKDDDATRERKRKEVTLHVAEQCQNMLPEEIDNLLTPDDTEQIALLHRISEELRHLKSY